MLKEEEEKRGSRKKRVLRVFRLQTSAGSLYIIEKGWLMF